MKRLPLLIILASAAFAQEAHEKRGAEFKAACGADVEKTCAGTEHKAMFECLKAHKPDLSEGCRTFLDSHHHGEAPKKAE